VVVDAVADMVVDLIQFTVATWFGVVVAGTFTLRLWGLIGLVSHSFSGWLILSRLWVDWFVG